jgi:hypothetical protein
MGICILGGLAMFWALFSFIAWLAREESDWPSFAISLFFCLATIIGGHVVVNSIITDWDSAYEGEAAVMGRPVVAIPIGKRFEKLVVIAYVGGGNDALWRCLCDCGKETVATGSNLRAGRNPSCGCIKRRQTDLVTRVKRKVTVKENGCWIWNDNYRGQTTLGGRSGRRVKVHRALYEATHGPIPDGLLVCHNCPGGDNPHCVNPDHMFLGTHADNMNDFLRKREKNDTASCA